MEDNAILDLYFSRQERAISETNKKYGKALRALSKSITNSPEDSEEIVNDTFLEAWRQIPPLRPSSLFAWLSRVTRNLSYKSWEKKTAEKRRGNMLEISEELEEILPLGESIDEVLERKELSSMIDAFLRSLDKESRILFMKRYYWSCSIDEISKEYDYSQSKVKSMLFRMRNKLKQKLEEENLL